MNEDKTSLLKYIEGDGTRYGGCVPEAIDLLALEEGASLLAKKLKVKREDLKTFFDSPESYNKALACYEKIKGKDKPVFEALIEYVLGYKEDEDSVIGEEAAALFEKHGKAFAESVKNDILGEDDINLENDLQSGDRKRAISAIVKISENCGVVAKHSVATLSSQNAPISSLMEVLSEEVFSHIRVRSRAWAWLTEKNRPLLEAVLNNKRTPRQALVLVITALMSNWWQIEMLRNFGAKLNASPDDIDAAIEDITKKPLERKDRFPERPLVEKKSVPVSAIKRIKDPMSK